ncbi:MAG: restriction endonuclease subunit S [Cyanobacteriota bacterium]
MAKNSKKETRTIEELLEEALVPESGQPYKIPDNWVWTRLVNISNLITKQTGFDYTNHIKPSLLNSKIKDSIPMIQTRNFNKNGFSIDTEYYIPLKIAEKFPKIVLNEKSLLLSIVGASIGNVGFFNISNTCFLGGAISIIKLNLEDSYEYVFNFLQSHEGQIQIKFNEKSTAQPTITVQNIREIPIPLPPIKEQKRIVEKLESMLGKIKQSKELIEEAKNTFKNRRASILAKAFSGKLTKNWREENPSNEDFSDILEKKPYKIPKSWKWKKLLEISTINMGQSPNGESYNEQGIGIPLINGPVEFGKEDLSFTIKSKWTTKPTKICEEGDLLICVRGSTTGRLNISSFKSCIGRGVASIRAKEYQKYLNYRILSLRKFIYSLGTGTTFPNISSKDLYNLDIPLPSLPEQKEIVRIVENLLKIENEALEKIESMEEHLELLEKSILSKAFRGELGTNNPDEESSISLLKEILEESKNDIVSIKDSNKISNKQEQISFLN